MAQVTKQVLVEGLNNLVLRVNFLSNGVDGELENYVLLTPAELTPAKPAAPCLRIMQVWWGFVWFNLTVSYGDTVPRPFWNFPRDSDNHVDFRHFGGLSDTQLTPPSGANGSLLLSTDNFAPVGSQGSMVIEFRK